MWGCWKLKSNPGPLEYHARTINHRATDIYCNIFRLTCIYTPVTSGDVYGYIYSFLKISKKWSYFKTVWERDLWLMLTCFSGVVFSCHCGTHRSWVYTSLNLRGSGYQSTQHFFFLIKGWCLYFHHYSCKKTRVREAWNVSSPNPFNTLSDCGNIFLKIAYLGGSNMIDTHNHQEFDNIKITSKDKHGILTWPCKWISHGGTDIIRDIIYVSDIIQYRTIASRHILAYSIMIGIVATSMVTDHKLNPQKAGWLTYIASYRPIFLRMCTCVWRLEPFVPSRCPV